jgi:hypothetical protein
LKCCNAKYKKKKINIKKKNKLIVVDWLCQPNVETFLRNSFKYFALKEHSSSLKRPLSVIWHGPVNVVLFKIMQKIISQKIGKQTQTRRHTHTKKIQFFLTTQNHTTTTSEREHNSQNTF